MGCVGASLRVYVGNLQVLWGVFEPVWGWQPKGLMGCVEPVWAVCWQPRQPTSLMVCVGASLGLYAGNLQVLWGVLEPVCGCMLTTYRSYGVCLSQFGAGNPKVLWGVWSPFGAVCWQPRQPTCLMVCVGASLGLYAGNLQVLWGVLEPVCGCMLTTYRSYGVCLSQFGAGNPKVLWGVWSPFGAVCWQPRQPTCLMVCVGASLGLYAGNLQVLWGVLEPVLGLATYMSYGVRWSKSGGPVPVKCPEATLLWGVTASWPHYKWSQFWFHTASLHSGNLT